MRVSVVLCTYDAAQFAVFCEAADSVLAQIHSPIELVVVVDGSPQLYDRVVEEYGHHENVVVHLNDENRGLLESRNRGAKVASGEVVAFIDDDARADADWVAELVAAYERKDALAVGGRMVPDWVAGRPRFLPEEFYWLVGVTHRGFGPGGDENRAGEVRNTLGSNLSFCREVFLELEGFDAAIGGRKGDNKLQGGETELCARLEREHGSGVHYVPEARVAHKVFSYRTDPRWLAGRAFWQGYSKHAMEGFVPDSTGEESAFLGRLLAEFLPSRLWDLLRRPSRERAAQLVALVVFTVLVGLGYAYGIVRYPGGFEGATSETESASTTVLWLTPDKPENISVGRRRIAERLRERGFDVTMRGTTPRTVLASLRGYKQYDVVVGTTRAGAIAGIGLKLLGLPLIIDHIDPIRQFTATRSRPLSFAVRLAENAAFALADHVLYVYAEERERVERYARDATETDLGVAHDRFADPEPTTVTRAREHLDEDGVGLDAPIVVYVGGLEPIYRIPELLAAMAFIEDWTLVVLGTGSLSKTVERAAGERENVVFPGSVPHEDVPGYLHAADVGVSLVDDPHTLKVLEYAAADLGVVCARGRAENRFGSFVEFCDPEPRAIARAIEGAGERGASEEFRERIREFDYERVAADYAAVLSAVAEKRAQQ